MTSSLQVRTPILTLRMPILSLDELEEKFSPTIIFGGFINKRCQFFIGLYWKLLLIGPYLK